MPTYLKTILSLKNIVCRAICIFIPAVLPSIIMKAHEKTKKNPQGAGRIPKEIDLKRVAKLSEMMFLDRELAAALNISYATFKRAKASDPRIEQAMADGQAKGCGSLRRKQVALAMKGDRTMLKWLGVQYLGQKEKHLHGSDPNNPMPAATNSVVAKNIYNFSSPEEAAAAFEQRLRGG